MKSLLLYLFFGFLTLAMPIQALSDNNLSSKSAVKRDEALEKKHADMIKALKKEHKAQVTIEQWNDGRNYYILRKNRTFARADMQGNLITFVDDAGKQWSFFQSCDLQKMSNGEIITNLTFPTSARNSAIAAGLTGSSASFPTRTWAFTSGKIYMGGGKCTSIDNGGEILVKVEHKNGTETKCELYALDGRKLIDRPLYHISTVSANKTFIDDYGMECKMACGMKYLRCKENMGSKGKRTFIVLGDQVINVPGNAFAGGLLYTDDFTTTFDTQAQEMLHCSSKGDSIQCDAVMRVFIHKPSTIYHSLTNEKIADNVVSITHLSGTHYAIYECGSRHSAHNRIGFVELTPTGKFSPCLFTDLYVTDAGQIMVKVNVWEDFQPYNPNHHYTPDNVNTFEHLAHLVEQGETLSAQQQEILTSHIIHSLHHDIMVQKQIQNMMNNDQKFRNLPSDSLSHMGFKVSYSSITFNKKAKTYYPPFIEKCSQPQIDAEGPVANLYRKYDTNFYMLNLALVQSNLRKTTANSRRLEEQTRQVREEAERQKRMQERREKIAKLDNFQKQLNEVQSIINSAAANRTNSSKNSNTGKSQTAVTKTGALPTKQTVTSTKEDHSGRKAWLRNEIANWENKLKKAEKSYRDAVSSGEDTWQKKRVIESKLKTVNECLEMKRQYEAELNSLK